MIDLHHLAGLPPAVAAAPALGVAVELAPPLGLCSPVVECDRLGLAGPDQACNHAPGGGRRKLVADRVETIKIAVRIFGLHGAFSRLSADGWLSSTMLPEKFLRSRLPKNAVRREEAGGPACI